MHKLFLSCDWGTSSFRLRLVHTATLEVLAESTSDEGVAKVFAQWQQSGTANNRVSFFQSILQQHVAVIEKRILQTLSGLPLVISGMASSSIGMMELPYRHLPFSASGAGLLYELVAVNESFSHPVILVSGARTDTDVMRGEETQLAGCIEQLTTATGLFIFPGTHSKHITVGGGQATHLHTYMTGEAFQLFANKSILANSVAANDAWHDKGNRAAFEQGVLDGTAHNILHQAFMVRTNSLFNRYTAAANFWYLSGLLIGAELQALQHAPPPSITIVGAGTIVTSYQKALDILGVQNVGVADVNKALIRAHAMILNEAYSNFKQ
jgi:2-dehydro-3-deoxygalactonokinase